MSLIRVVLAASTFIVSSVCSAQVVSYKTAATASIQNYPYLDLSTVDKAHALRQIGSDEAERATRYSSPFRPPLFNEQAPQTSGSIRWSSSSTHGSAYDPLPVSNATLVVLGTVTSATPHLSRSGNSVYSTFTIVPSHYLKHDRDEHGTTIIAERKGGMVLYPSGKKRFDGDTELGLPVPGYEYLLFLKEIAPGSFEILRGYGLTSPSVTSLDAVEAPENHLTKQALLIEVQSKL